jgi:hypothetical protein
MEAKDVTSASPDAKAKPALSEPRGWFGFRKRRPEKTADDCLPGAALNELRANITSQPLTDDVAEVVSATIGLGERIRSQGLYIEDALDRLNFVLSCALQEQPRLILARDEILRLQNEINRNSRFFLIRWLAKISAGSSTALVLAALVASLLIWMTVALLMLGLLNQLVSAIFGFTFRVGGIVSAMLSDIFFMDQRALLVIASAAILGGIVSIATRLGEFSRIQGLDPFAMFWMALLKPLIGVALSFFILAALAGEVIGFGFLGKDPIGIGELVSGQGKIPVKTLYILWVIGFLAGFSERFAWDFVQRTEGAAGGNAGGNVSKAPP